MDRFGLFQWIGLREFSHETHRFSHEIWGYMGIYLGKLSYFTDLNLAAIKKGDDFPYKNHDFQASGEQGSVVMKFTQMDWFCWENWNRNPSIFP